MCVRGLSFRVRLEVMSGFAQRIRYAVSRISAVEQYSLSSLPVLERSLVPVLSVASTFYTFGILVRQLLYQLGIFGRTRCRGELLLVFLHVVVFADSPYP